MIGPRDELDLRLANGEAVKAPKLLFAGVQKRFDVGVSSLIATD